MILYKTLEQVDNSQQEFTLECAQAAYDAYPGSHDTTLDGYLFRNWLSAATPFVESTVHKEQFVAVFQSVEDPNDWLLSFKGSATKWDWWEDFKFFSSTIPFHNDTKDAHLEAADGFIDIYTTDITSGESLQQQLFKFLEGQRPRSLKISGHSLGSALAELFMFDLLYCAPTYMPLTVQQINFACPKVFKYEAAMHFRESLDFSNHTCFRVVNTKDLVPIMPELGTESSILYYHATDEFPIDFFKNDEWGNTHIYVFHSMVNYKNCLNILNLTLPITSPQKQYAQGVELDPFSKNGTTAIVLECKNAGRNQ